MLKAVTFDLWQTLLLDTPEGLGKARADRIRGVWEILRRQGIPVELPRVEEAYDGVAKRLEQIWATHHDIGSRGQVRWVLEGLGLGKRVPPEDRLMDDLDDAYSLPILSALPLLNIGAREVLARLHGDGLSLALICNTGRTSGRMLRLVLDRLGLAPFLSILTFSDEVGLRKPHPEIFRRTLSALAVVPGDAAHVGDDVRTDVAGARGVGMRAIHLRHPKGASQDSDGVEGIATLGELPALLLSARHPAGNEDLTADFSDSADSF
jgi:FMN phosphatase YigB (HAD superfamily)